jgi:hypothetical protein
MIRKIDSYSVVCDHCHKSLITSHDGFSIFIDENIAHEAADNEEWHEEDGVYYCKECYYFDDDDVLHLRPERKVESPSLSLPETEQEPHIRVQLKDGSIAKVSPNASPELLKAMETMVELAKKIPDPDQPVLEEVIEWIEENGQLAARQFALGKLTHEEGAAYYAGYFDEGIARYKEDQATISSLESRLSHLQQGLEEARNDVGVYRELYKKAFEERDAIKQAYALQAEELRKYRNQPPQ